MRSLRHRGFALRTLSVWALVAFHAALLARRLADPAGLDATAALRWAGAFLLFGSAFALRAWAARLSQRQLLALGLAAVALHAPVFQGPAEADRAAGFWIALPGLLAPVLALAALAGVADRERPAAAALRIRDAFAPRPLRRSRPPFAPRPPPCS